MFEIRELNTTEATGSLIGSAISCIGTWASVALLWGAVCC